MKKSCILKKISISLLIFSLGLIMLSPHVLAKEIEPYAIIHPCDGSYKKITSIEKDKLELINRTGYYLDVGNSMTYTFGRTDSVSNSGTLTLFPNLQASYEISLSINSSVSFTVVNNTGKYAEVKRYRVYDKINYQSGIYDGAGGCQVSNSSAKAYVGYMMSCR